MHRGTGPRGPSQAVLEQFGNSSSARFWRERLYSRHVSTQSAAHASLPIVVAPRSGESRPNQEALFCVWLAQTSIGLTGASPAFGATTIVGSDESNRLPLDRYAAGVRSLVSCCCSDPDHAPQSGSCATPATWSAPKPLDVTMPAHCAAAGLPEVVHFLVCCLA